MDNDIPKVRMTTKTMSNEEIETLFTEEFKELAADVGVEEFEAICERAPISDKIKMAVNIIGFAGTPTAAEFEALAKKRKILIGRIDKGRLSFRFQPSQTVMLGGIDYQVIYESE